jgi:hypothetical protein
MPTDQRKPAPANRPADPDKIPVARTAASAGLSAIGVSTIIDGFRLASFR